MRQKEMKGIRQERIKREGEGKVAEQETEKILLNIFFFYVSFLRLRIRRSGIKEVLTEKRLNAPHL